MTQAKILRKGKRETSKSAFFFFTDDEPSTQNQVSTVLFLNAGVLHDLIELMGHLSHLLSHHGLGFLQLQEVSLQMFDPSNGIPGCVE